MAVQSNHLKLHDHRLANKVISRKSPSPLRKIPLPELIPKNLDEFLQKRREIKRFKYALPLIPRRNLFYADSESSRKISKIGGQPTIESVIGREAKASENEIRAFN